MAGLVALVSDDPSIDGDDARKDDLRERVRAAGGYALAVYAADKVSKVREIRTALAAGAPAGGARSQARPAPRSLAMLDASIPGSRLVELLRFEIEALDEMPPG